MTNRGKLPEQISADRGNTVSRAAYITPSMRSDLHDALGEWRGWLAYEKRFSSHTLDAYQRDINGFLVFLIERIGSLPGLADLEAIQRADFRSYLAHRAALKNGRSSIARSLSTIRNLFQWLERRDLIENGVIWSVRTPKVPRTLPRPLSIKEARQVIEEAGAIGGDPWLTTRDAALYTMLWACGLRIGEALGLNRSEAPDGESMVITGKGNRQRLVPVLTIVSERIDAYLAVCPYKLKPDDPLFVGKIGRRLSPGVVQRRLRDLRAKLGMPETVTPHAFRHSFATHLLATDGDIRTIQELLGHVSISTTQIYTEVDDAKIMEVYMRAHPRAHIRSEKPTVMNLVGLIGSRQNQPRQGPLFR